MQRAHRHTGELRELADLVELRRVVFHGVSHLMMHPDVG